MIIRPVVTPTETTCHFDPDLAVSTSRCLGWVYPEPAEGLVEM